MPASFFVEDVDMIIDNKKFDIPTTARARSCLAQQQVRFHLRTRAEGTRPECVKPCRKKNRINTGGVASVCAGVDNTTIVPWHYLPKKWNGDEARKLYMGPIIRKLKEHRGSKRTYNLIEDNDPTGYKSSKAQAAKKAVGIKALPMPRYSRDLNHLDYSLWAAIEKRMIERAPKRIETVDAYKRRLRPTALRLPKRLIEKAVSAMPKCLREVVAAGGHCIKGD